MRMPLGCSLTVAGWGVFTLLGLPLRLGAAEPGPDEAVLRRAGVSADAKSLLTFFRERAGNDDDLMRVDALVRQLGSTSFKAREEAAEKLVRLGPAADEALSAAMRSKDSEIAGRAKTILRKTRDRHDTAVVSAALRLLMRKKPEGTAEALLRYLPYAAHGPLTDELWWSLDTLAAARPKLDSAIVKALDDSVAVRRAAAAYLAARRGDAEQRALARKRLADADPLVRLRAAQGLLGRGRKEGVPILIDLLRGTSLEVAWQAEELLYWAAGEQVPEAVLGAGREATRVRCRDAWRTWWRTRGDALDLARVLKSGRRPGLVLVSWGSTVRDKVTVGVWLLGCSGGPRLEVKTQSIVWDLHLLPGGRLLLAEYLPRGVTIGDGSRVTKSESPAGRVTIRDPEGEVLWKWEKTIPVACYPLAGGNLLVAERTMVTEVTPAGQAVWSHNFSLLSRDVPEMVDYPQRLPNGNFVGISEPGPPGRVDLVETDPEGARMVKQVTLREAVSLVGRVRIKTTERGTYLLGGTSDGVVREIDGSGKTIWKSRPLGNRDVVLLKDGTLVIATGRRVVEFTRSGGVAWEALLPPQASAQAARPCLGLVRLGFDAPRPADLDLDASVEYRLAGLKSRDPHVRRWSANLLGDMGRKAEAAVPALIEALHDPDEDMRLSAASALTKVTGPKMLPRLLALAEDKDPRVRVSVVSICGGFPDHSQAVVPVLIRALQDHALVKFGPGRGETRVSRAAAHSLWNLGPRAKEAVPALIAALKSKDTTLRWLAADALGRIGPDAKQAIPALKELLNDPDNVVRIYAAESLKRIQR